MSLGSMVETNCVFSCDSVKTIVVKSFHIKENAPRQAA